MSWPLSQDYNESVQSPARNFTDPDLRRGQAPTNALGVPLPCSGNFADVYELRCPDGGRWAVKCFTREVPGLRQRYEAISQHLRQAKLPFTVDFSYLDEGIRVAGRWFPVVKMQWVEGFTLNQFVAQAADKPATLDGLLHIWGRMGKYLRAAAVAHADLQHGNVLLVPGASGHSLALMLVDYDGLWVPALAGKKSGEVGHPSYQHPQRSREGTYSLDVDRFPLLLGATALSALRTGGRELWDRYDNGDNLLFKESDLLAPTKSHLFRDLLRSTDPQTVALTHQLLDALRAGLEAAPLLEEMLPEARPAPPPTAGPVPTVKPVAVPVTADEQGSPFGGLGNGPPPPPPGGQTKQRRGGARAAPAWPRYATALAVIAGVFTAVAVGAWVLGGKSSSPASPTQDRPKDPTPPDEASVVLEVDQAGAEVWIDGQKMSVPVPGNNQVVKIGKVKPGRHQLLVSKDGFEPYAGEVEAKPDNFVPTRVRLRPQATVAQVLAKRQPLYRADFDNPRSNWPAGKKDTTEYGYAGGTYFLRVPKGLKWYNSSPYQGPGASIACEVVGRLDSQLANGWGVKVAGGERSIRVAFMGMKRLVVGSFPKANDPEDGPQLAPVEHEAVRPVNEWNTLLVVVRDGRQVEVYSNGTLVMKPFSVDRPITPATLSLCVMAPYGETRAEFKHFLVWSAEGLPAPR